MLKTKPEITTAFNRKLLMVNNAYRKFIQCKLKEHKVDLTFEMLQVMYCLWTNDTINQQEIANVTVKDKASMTYLIDNLTKRGLVSRIEDTSDRRNKLILLTEEGKLLKTKIQPVMDEMHEVSGKNIDVAKLKEFMAVLDKIEENLKG
jgi:DNA-binding MarR family transcriptional regulator